MKKVHKFLLVALVWVFWVLLVLLILQQKRTANQILTEEYRGSVVSDVTEANCAAILFDNGFEIIDQPLHEYFEITEKGNVFTRSNLDHELVIGAYRNNDHLNLLVKGTGASGRHGSLGGEVAKFLHLFDSISNRSIPKPSSLVLEMEQPKEWSVSDSDKRTTLQAEMFPTEIDSNHWELQIESVIDCGTSADLRLELNSKIRIFIDQDGKIVVEPCTGFFYGAKQYGESHLALSVHVKPHISSDGKFATTVIKVRGSFGSTAYLNKSLYLKFTAVDSQE